MGILEASRTVEIDAPKSECYAIISDLPATPEWQESMISIDVLETDSEGRASLVEIKSDGKVKEISSRIAFEYQPEDGMTWDQKKGAGIREPERKLITLTPLRSQETRH